MQTLSVFCFGLLALAVTADYCSTGSSFPKDCQNRQKDCGLLLGGGKKHPGSGESKTTTPAAASTTVSFVSSTHGECDCTCSGESSGSEESSGSDESSGSGSDESSGSSEEGSGLLPYDDYCLLLQYFYNISFEITDVEIYEAWIIFIHECQYEIIYDESLTIEEKLVAIWAKLEIFIEIHIEIKYIVLYTYISEWSGFIFDLEAVSLFVQYQFTETIVELDVSGNCVLFESLLNATSGNSALYAKVEILIQELRLILEVETYTYAYKLVLIYEKIQAFFVQYSSYELTILEIEIEGYGYFSSFYEVCANYWRVYYYSIAVGGSASSCELVQVLTAAYQNTSCGSSAQRAQIKQFVTDLTTYFSSNTDVEARVEFFVSEFYQFIILQEWSIEIIFSLEIEGYGSIYELLLAYSFEFNFGPFDFGSQTTTVAPTTHATGQCSLSSQIVAFASNTSDLSWSIDYAQQGWNSTQISRFAAYKQRIWTVTGNSTATSQEIIANVVNVFNKWTTNTYYLDLVYSIQIYVFHATSQQYYWGTVQQFCDCNA